MGLVLAVYLIQPSTSCTLLELITLVLYMILSSEQVFLNFFYLSFPHMIHRFQVVNNSRWWPTLVWASHSTAPDWLTKFKFENQKIIQFDIRALPRLKRFPFHWLQGDKRFYRAEKMVHGCPPGIHASWKCCIRNILSNHQWIDLVCHRTLDCHCLGFR